MSPRYGEPQKRRALIVQFCQFLGVITMATAFPVGSADDIAAKLWAKKLMMDTVHGQGLLADMVSDGIMVMETDLSRNAGDRIRKFWNQRLSSKGIIGDGAVRPNAKDIQRYHDDIVIDKLTQVVKGKDKGSMSQQRATFDLLEDQGAVLADWFKERITLGAFNQLGGNTATTLTYDGETYTGDDRKQITGLQIPTAPTSNRLILADSANNSTENAVNSGTDRFKLALVDSAVDLAFTQFSGTNNFKPIVGKPYKFKLYLGHKAFNDLIQEGVSGGILSLSQLELARLSGGKDASYVGDFFDYNYTRVVRVPEHFMPIGNNSGTALPNVKRALFCGREAACLAFGRGYDNGKDPVAGFNIVEDTDKIEEEVVAKVTSICGVKKAVVNSQDQSVITISHYVS